MENEGTKTNKKSYKVTNRQYTFQIDLLIILIILNVTKPTIQTKLMK